MPIEFDTTGEPLDASQSYVHTLSDESGFYGQTFVATSASLSQIEFAIDTFSYGSTATFTVMIATVRFDANGLHPDAVLFESPLITVSADADDVYDVMSVAVSGLELLPGERYVILFNSNAGDGNGLAAMRSATNPSDDDGNFVYQHTGSDDPANSTVFSQDWYEDAVNGTSGWGDIAIRLTYDSVNVIDGTPGDDVLFGTAGADETNGYEGNDGLYGEGGDDSVSGGDGHDDVRGGAGNDSLYGDAGDDLLYGNAGDDYIDGGEATTAPVSIPERRRGSRSTSTCREQPRTRARAWTHWSASRTSRARCSTTS